MKQTKKNRYKYVAGVATVAMVASTIAPITSNAAKFTDVTGTPHENAINTLVNMGVINGYPDGTFKPTKELKRSDVVKLLGKYLVSQGASIPSDYKTNMRFSDLNSKANDELLKYAAVVKDAGVFNGSKGKLMPDGKMLREQMALVLVRAFSEINQFDYISYVNEQSFTPEIKDLSKASLEAQNAIRVLDYYDVTKAANFHPKNVTQRGQFASLLYNMMTISGGPIGGVSGENLWVKSDLWVKSAEAISRNSILVVLSDNTTHTVTLSEPLDENVAKTVSFTINNVQYSSRVTYFVDEFKVVKVENLNGGQFVIHFNQQVNSINSTNNSDILAENFKLTKIENKKEVALKKGELSADKRSYKITIGESEPLEKGYRLEMKNVRSIAGHILNYDESVYFNEDNTSPNIQGTEIVNENEVKVYFTEPVNGSFSDIEFQLADGDFVTGITGDFEKNATEILFDLSGAKIGTDSLALNTEIKVIFGAVKDIAGNISSPKNLRATIIKGKKDGVKPSLVSVTQMGSKQFKLTFSEEMATFKTSDLSVQKGSTSLDVEKVERDEKDKKSFIITLDDYLQGDVTISTASGSIVADSTGETATFSKTQYFSYDTTKAQVVRTEVIRDENAEYLTITFDRNVDVKENSTLSIEGKYVVGGMTYNIPENASAKVLPVSTDGNKVRVLLKELLKDFDREDAQFDVNITFNNLTNEYNLGVVDVQNIQFARSKDYTFNDNKLKVLSIDTSRTSDEIKENNRILINFNLPVDAATASNKKNYDLLGYSIKSALVNTSNPSQVELMVTSYSSKTEDEPIILIENIKSENSLSVMDDFSEKILMNETIKPSYKNYVITDDREVTLTFSEAISEIDEDYFIVESSVEDVEVNVTARNHPTDESKIVLTFETDSPRGQTLTLKLKPNKEITDIYGNKVNLNPIRIYITTSFW